MSVALPRFGWVLNLDAEFELARPGYTPRVRLSNQLERYGATSRALLGARDVLVERGMTAPPGLIGRAWCPTPAAVATLRAAGVEPEPHPTESVLRRVNHRKFAFDVGGGLPGQRYLESRGTLEPLLGEAAHPWLLKRPLAFAGRGQMRAIGTLSEKQWSWVDASFRTDGLIAEPLVVPILEVSLHGFAWQDGRVELGRICVQEVTARGVFRAVRLATARELAPSEEQALAQSAELVGSALREAGYFGPFGVDAYRYTSRGETGFCANSEINARYTMGFSTGFPRHPSELSLA